ncbi:VC0807 family protein [Tsukamurella soli]|uniref:Uncharacterized protein n=1 Tax=Tsukamurella soli TaxID=644556 RepID=A0ABP8K003_9ACTN
MTDRSGAGGLARVLTTPPPAILGALLPMPLYFALTRLAGWTQLSGVVAGVVVGLVIALWRMLATRKVEQLGLFATAVLAVSLIPSLVARDPRIVLAAQSVDGYFAAACFLVTAFTRSPLVASVLQPLYATLYKVSDEAWQRCMTDTDDFRGRIRGMSFVCAGTGVTGSTVGLLMALNLPIDTVVLLGPFIGVVLFPTAALILRLLDRPLREALRAVPGPEPR